MSAWRRTPGQLTYTLICCNRLLPQPSRVNNNYQVAVLCMAAGVWVRCNTDPTKPTELLSLSRASSDAFSVKPDTNPFVLSLAGGSPSPKASAPIEFGMAAFSLDGVEAEQISAVKPAGAAPKSTGAVDGVYAISAGSGAAVESGVPAGSAAVPAAVAVPLESLLVMVVTDEGHIWCVTFSPQEGF